MHLIFHRMQLLLTVVGIIVVNFCFAQGGEPALIKVLDGGSGNFKVDSFVTVEDTKWWTPAEKAKIDTTLPYKIRNIVTVKFNEESTKFIKSNFTTSVYVKIIYTNKNNSVDSIGNWFTINFDSLSGNSYNSQRILTLTDGYRITTRIDTITTTYTAGVTAWDVTPHLRLENEMQISRYYNFACTSALTSLNQSTASIATTGDLRYTWSPVTGATEYDIEWTFIDSVMLAEGTTYGTVASPDRTKIFEAGATRNTVYNGDFYVPLFYDNSSYLFVRVRPVQVRAGNQRVEGAWYPSTGAGYYFTGHETGLNWQSTTTFAEEGKRKTVVSYADGSLKQRQTVTRDNVAVSTPQAIASETLYDYQGRPAIQVLPAPNLGGVIKYIHDLNKSLAGGEYEKSLYDSLINPSDYCNAAAPAMSNTSGANKYYSSGNAWAAMNNSHKALPVANGFAFAETRYAQDNTGRIMAQGGVGQQYQVGSKHETKYYYGKPDSLEMFALFGTEVGDPSHYQKNMVRDANGQYSVSYVDMKGRTIATALAGVPDTAVVKLDTLESHSLISVTKKLLDPSTTVIDGFSMQNTTGLVVTKAGMHEFHYTLSPDSLKLATCNNTNICYDCVYNLEISVSDECNNQLLPSNQRYVLLDSNFTMATLDTLCNTITGFSKTFYLNLPEGSYTIAKKLTVSRPGYEYYRDSVFMIKNLCKTFEEFYAEELSVLQQNCAEETCASCNTSLGTLEDFTENYAEENGIPSEQIEQYENQIQQAYNTAKANCDLICDSLSENDQIKEMMLADMSPEGGQYANTEDNNYDKNIFYRLNSSQPYVYQQISPAYYADENGKRDSIYNSNGELMPPDHSSITPEEFMAQFKPSWAEALLSKHPEYCKYQAGEQLRQSNIWDKKFSETETYADAKAKGYLNPINQSGTGYSFMPIVSGGQDPLSSVSATLSGQTLYNLLKDKLLNYVNINGTMRSMWGLATATAHCNEGDETCFTTFIQNANAFDSVQLCRGDLDMAWRSFQQLYSSEKRKLIGQWLAAQCSYAVPDSFYRHYPDLDAILAGTGTTSTDPNTNTAAGTDSLNAAYGSNCEAYVQNWWRQIAPCNFNATDSSNIIPKLIQVCKEGSDATHPFGSSSVKPTSTYQFKNFDQVIRHYLDSTNRSSEYNANCNGYLVTAPAPYENPAAYADVPLWTKPDSCQCEKITGLYDQFLATPVADSNFSGYLKRKLNVDMTEGALQQLLNMCNGVSACKFLEQPIDLPPQLQCGNNNGCVGCDSITVWHNRFIDSFSVTPQYDGNDSLQSIHNRLYENYMNYHSGLKKYYTDYLLMKNNCPAGNANCDTLKQVLADFREEYFNTPSYSIAYNADGCDTTSWSFVHTDTSSVGKAKYAHMFSNGEMHPPDSMFNYLTNNTWLDSAKMKLINFTYPRKICSVNNEFRWDVRLRHNIFYGTTSGVATLLSMKLEMSGSTADSTLYIYLDQYNAGKIIFGGEGAITTYNSSQLQVDLTDWKLVSVRIVDNKIKVYIDDQFRYERSYPGNIVKAGHFSVNPHYTDIFVDYIRIFNGNGQVILSENFNNACESFAVQNPFYDCNKDNCDTAFTEFYNEARGTNLTLTQIQQLYVQHCGQAAQHCQGEDDGLKLCPDEALFSKMIVADQGPCSDSSDLAFVLATEKYNLYKDSLRAAFDSVYLNKCMKAYKYENLTVTAEQSEFHYTLYYYDQAGNLVKTVPPAGVDMSKFGYLESWKDSVATAKLNNQSLRPSHQLPTNYRYNTLNQVKTQHSPDGGKSEFWYDRLGRLVLSQNAKQKPGNWFSYTVYDSIGRITEVGELKHENGPSVINDSIARSQTALNDLITLNTKRQITNTYYDVAYAGFSGLSEPLVAKHLRSRVSYTTYTEGSNPALYDQATFYSYDIHGNVDTLLQDYRTGLMNDQNQRFKKLVYQYDLISGKVNHVAYQANKTDQFYHRYTYDGENRVTQAQTSADSIVWERDAMYSYLMHGPLARTVLGQQKVQGQDYAYTLQGWLKAINGVGTNFEVGNDGTTITAPNQYVAKDAYSLMLHYNSSDYSSVLNTCYCVSNTLNLPATHSMKNLYNGNIAGMSVNITKLKYPVATPATYMGSMYYNYKYDQLNRITQMDAYTKLLVSQNTLTYNTALTDYKERIKYDANGNILKYLRNGMLNSSVTQAATGPLTMDSLEYKYYAGSNQLRQVKDTVNAANYTEDIDNQSDTSNYVYDAIGNLIQDKHEGIDSIKWNVYGKIQSIHKSNGTNIYYTYDAGGNRISKTVGASSDTTVTWYVRDASGNVMSVYRIDNDTTHQEELHLYGSSRIGILKPERILNLDTQYGDTSIGVSILGTAKGKVFRRGLKFFELSNHLQNVLVTISDKKLGVDAANDGNVDYFNPDVMSANDYYPFGMVMPGRKFSSGQDYRYGQNGQEKSTELNNDSYTADFWQYDSRIGRRWNVDPVPKVYESPYTAFGNNPIWNIDPDGADTSKLTGNNNLLIFIQDGKAKIDYDKMKKDANGWDFVVVENMQGAEKLLKDYYDDKTGFIENLVVKSHGQVSTGPDLDNAAGNGVVHNPAGNKQMEYVRSLLTNSANICFTACSIIQGYNDPKHKGYKSAQQTANSFSKFFLKGTNRNMFMNYTLSTSSNYDDANKNKSLDAGESYWFNFDKGLHQQSWGGFMWFYSGQKGTVLKQKSYYQVIVETGGWFSDGGLKVNPITPIDPNDVTPNAEPPKKAGL